MKITYTKGKNSMVGNPRINVVDFTDVETMNFLIEKKVFRKNKNGIVSVANSSFVYGVSDNKTSRIEGKNILFVRQW